MIYDYDTTPVFSTLLLLYMPCSTPCICLKSLLCLDLHKLTVFMFIVFFFVTALCLYVSPLLFKHY